MASHSLECRWYHSANIPVLARFRAYGGSRAWHVFVPMAYNQLKTDYGTLQKCERSMIHRQT